MPFHEVIYIVFPVFAIIGIGFLFASFKKIDLSSIIDILLFLTIPAFIIASLLKKSIDVDVIISVAFSAAGVVLGVGLLSYFYLRLTKRTELKGFYLPTMFMNSGNMAFPLVLLAFGEEGLAYAVIYFITVGILVYTLGIYLAKGKGGWKEVFKLPLIYAALLGLYLNIAHIKLPEPIFNTLDILGDATIPLMLLSLGLRLRSIKVSHLSLSVTGAVIRIFGGIIIATLIVSASGLTGLAQKVILISSAMPSAVISFIVAERYNLQSDLVASITFISTILSVFTTPFLLAWIMK